ncbi:hypothetical protein FU323_06360 [Lactobacillus delbrueckii subsp. bulgaricus]|nr:hypothetical protein FU323_06360 [Lactobacillus delbrueckii subsp. bulgaricus]
MDKLKKKMPKNKYARAAISLTIFFACILPIQYLFEKLKLSFSTFWSTFIGVYLFRKIIVALGIQRHNF